MRIPVRMMPLPGSRAAMRDTVEAAVREAVDRGVAITKCPPAYGAAIQGADGADRLGSLPHAKPNKRAGLDFRSNHARKLGCFWR